MTDGQAIADRDASPAQPVVRKIGVADLKDALAGGFADFNAMPTHLIFLCIIYPVVTLIAARVYAGYDVLPLVFPLLAGYTMIGPLVATGMYELSRRREQGLDTSRMRAFDVFRSPSIGAIATLGAGLMVVYFAWLGLAWAIYALTFGSAVPTSILGFVDQVLTTSAGWTLIIVGGGVGFLFATVAFTLSVVSFPMLLDRDVGIVTAVQTSIRAVLANPITMAIWGFVIAATLFIGALPVFVGLAVALPVIGHAAWHLYRKVVAH